MGDYLLEIAEVERAGIRDLKKHQMAIASPFAIEIERRGFPLSREVPMMSHFRGLTYRVETRANVLDLFGPNGAGKTTLISLMTGLLTGGHTGHIKLLGKEKSVKRKEMVNRLFGYVPQDFSFYQELSPVENLAIFWRLGRDESTGSH